MNLFRFVAAAALFGAPCAFSVETSAWIHNSQADFEKGALRNVSLRSDGRLSLAPSFREIADPSIAYLWALAADSKGSLYAGGGSPSSTSSRLVAIDRSGKQRTMADLPGLQIQAIAVDGQDRVYAATNPDGKVYRIAGAGKAELFYDPRTKYVWALAFSSRGDLFVATGDSGEIHRVTPDGKGSVFFKTEETHVRSMAVDAKDNLIAGTEPGGLVLRITPAAEGFVLYQAARREVTAVAVAPDGAIYAAAVGTRAGASAALAPTLSIPTPQPAPQPAAPSGAPGARPPVQVVPSPAPGAVAPPPTIAGGSEVYRIGADDYPQRFWSHAQDVVYAISFDANGLPVIGTGNKGNIYRLDSSRTSTWLIDAAPTQITALARSAGGELYAATGNVGKVYRVGPTREASGSYESEALDAGFFSYWGRVRHLSEGAAQVRVETRSGNLDRPQKNWSAWSPLDAAARITSPPARFLQYRITMSGATSGAAPEVREIELAWMARNAPPSFDNIEITPANYRFNAPPPVITPAPQTVTLPPLGQRKRTGPALTIDSSSTQVLTYARGHIGARWAVTDPNNDDMLFRVEIRGAGEKEWKLLRDKVREKYVSWDSTAYPDGEYVVRVSASDLPENPPDRALRSVIDSERFIVDNTPPQIEGLTSSRTGGAVTVSWKARDTRSVISQAEYSVNGGEWVVAEPRTRLSDAPELEYTLTIQSSGPETTIAVRVSDEYDNQTVAKTVVQ